MCMYLLETYTYSLHISSSSIKRITEIALRFQTEERFGDTAGTVLEQRRYRPLSSEDPHKVGGPDDHFN